MPRQVHIFEKSEYLQDQTCPTPQKLIQPDPTQFWTLSRAGATHLHIWFYSTEGGQRLGSYLCSPHWHYSLSSPKILSKQVGRRCHKELFFPESMGEKRGPISEQDGWKDCVCFLQHAVARAAGGSRTRDGVKPTPTAPLALALKCMYCNNPWSYHTDDFGMGVSWKIKATLVITNIT